MVGTSDNRIEHHEEFTEPHTEKEFKRWVENYRSWYGKHPTKYGGQACIRDGNKVREPRPDEQSYKWVWIHK